MLRSGRDLVQLGLLGRGLATSASSLAVPAVAPSGLFSFFGSTQRVTTPLDTPLHGVEFVSPAPVPAKPPTTDVATLSNGVRVAAEASMGPYVVLGVFVNSGSVNETPYTAGASHLLEHMAFKGTQNRTHFMTVRAAEVHGVSLSANVSREQTVFYAAAPRHSAAAAMELLCDAVANPLYQEHIVKDTIDSVLETTRAQVADPKFTLMEGVMSAAYSGALARPLYYSGASHLNADILNEFHAANVTAERTVVAAAGLPLEVCKSLSQDYLGSLPSGGRWEVPRSKYVGGDHSDHFSNGAHVLIAFETSGWNDIEGSVMATVCQYLLGGGQDFSSGGPGKGMHSLLYQNVLTRHNWMSSCSAYANIFDDTGLLGVMASTSDPSRSATIVDIVCAELMGVSQTVTTAQVERAKRLTLSTVYQALEMPQIVCEDIGRQILTLGQRMELAKFEAAINAVTADGVKAYFRALLKSKPTGCLLGDQSVMPKFDYVRSRFG